MNIEEAIRNALNGENDYLGFADLTQVDPGNLSPAGIDLSMYPRAVSVGVRLIDDVVDLVPRQEERWAAIMYDSMAYDSTNIILDRIGARVASVLQRNGYHALPIPASRRVDDGRICGLFSHKMAAHLAGLGWIGKSCLLVTPDHGPRVRWTTVLTDAPLAPLGTPLEQRCGDCMECVKNCPTSAIMGRNFVEDEPREVRFDARLCDENYKRMKAEGKVQVCGMCLYACPYGRKSDR
jgi:epoxyqueuosine reductase QueG